MNFVMCLPSITTLSLASVFQYRTYLYIYIIKTYFNYIIYTICIYTYIYIKQQKRKKIIKNIMYIEHITNKNKTKDASQKRRHIIHHIMYNI